MSDVKTLLVSAVVGAVAGAAAAWGVSYGCKSTVGMANVQEIVASYPKVQTLQVEQKAKIESLTDFVNMANEEIEKEKNAEKKKELESKYMEELAVKRAVFEREYIEKLSKVSEELSELINSKAADKGYKLVLSRDSVVTGATDITAELVEAVK